MAMAMASTYTRWKRLVSGLAGGSSLESEANFNLGVVTIGKNHAARGEHFSGGRALSADEVISTWVLVLAKTRALFDAQVLSRPHP